MIKIDLESIKKSINDVVPNLNIKSIDLHQDGDVLKIKGSGYGIYPADVGIENEITKSILDYGYKCSFFSSINDTCTLDKVSIQLDKYK